MHHAAAYAGHFTGRDDARLVGKSKDVGHALRAHALHRDLNVEYVLATDRRRVLARRGHARKADRRAVDFRIDAQPDAPQQLMLGRFHVTEVGRKVHDAGHVGVAELD
jgi:hypothetical protein